MLHDVYECIHDCGWAAWLCVLFFLPALATALVALLLARRSPRAAWITGLVASALGVFAIVTALLGRQSGIVKVMGATSSQALDPAQRDRIRIEGFKEANQCLNVGGVTGGLPLVLGVIGAAMGYAATKRARGETA